MLRLDHLTILVGSIVLFVGGWIARTGSDAGISPFLLTPILLATFMAGPVGYLAYALLRLAIRPQVAS